MLKKIYIYSKKHRENISIGTCIGMANMSKEEKLKRKEKTKEQMKFITELGKANKGKISTKKHREKQSKAIEKRGGVWNKGLTTKTDERVKKGCKKSGQSRTGKKYFVYSERNKRFWQNPEFVKKQMKSRGVKPNKAELKLNELLQQILLKEYKYVGDGEFILAGKCPDFININGQKKIIELYGTYWHKGETGQDRIDLFEQYGYKTLIVWEDELKDIEDLKNKILNFSL